MIDTNKLDPRQWSKRNKIIAAIIAAILILTSITATVVTSHSKSVNAQACASRQEALTTKGAQLDQAIQDANDALKTVDASLEPGEGTRLMHTDGFPLSSEGQSAINDLSKAISEAKKAQTGNTTNPEQCPTEQDTTAIDAAIKAITDQTQSFIDVRDAYRLTKATDEANTLMDEAKSKLASAQQSASEQIATVEADPNMQSDASVKAAYDALKAVDKESHTLSNTVTVTTYDEAVASIEKAKAIDQKADEVATAQASLTEAVTAYQASQAGSATTSSESDTSGSTGTEQSTAPAPSYSGGSSYTPPAPAYDPAPSTNTGSGSGGRIDFGPGQADRPGCVIIEGRTVC